MAAKPKIAALVANTIKKNFSCFQCKLALANAQ
jgi:hypothetical protein